MDSKAYGEAPLWRVLTALAESGDQHVSLANLAGRLLAKSGYPGAYEAIGRAVAAGYAEYDLPVCGSRENARVGVRLTAAGRARFLHGQGYVAAQVAAWQARMVPAPRSPRWRRWHQLH